MLRASPVHAAKSTGHRAVRRRTQRPIRHPAVVACLQRRRHDGPAPTPLRGRGLWVLPTRAPSRMRARERRVYRDRQPPSRHPGGTHGLRQDSRTRSPDRARSEPSPLRQRGDAVGRLPQRAERRRADPAAAAAAGRRRRGSPRWSAAGSPTASATSSAARSTWPPATKASRATTCSRCTWTATSRRSTGATSSASPRSSRRATSTGTATSSPATRPPRHADHRTARDGVQGPRRRSRPRATTSTSRRARAPTASGCRRTRS